MVNTVLLLAMHPEAQTKVFAELNRVCKDQNSEISMKDLNQLEYLELVMKESMRVATVTPVITRKTSARVKLSKFRHS
jgi:cytochrome P450